MINNQETFEENWLQGLLFKYIKVYFEKKRLNKNAHHTFFFYL